MICIPLVSPLDVKEIKGQLTFEEMNGTRLMFSEDLYDNASDAFMSWKVLALRTVRKTIFSKILIAKNKGESTKVDVIPPGSCKQSRSEVHGKIVCRCIKTSLDPVNTWEAGCGSATKLTALKVELNIKWLRSELSTNQDDLLITHAQI